MPNFYAHLLFGREVSRRMPPELQRTLLRQWDAFCCGNFGPDPLYFYVGGRHAGAVRQAGIRLHHGSGSPVLRHLRRATCCILRWTAKCIPMCCAPLQMAR